MSYKRQTPWCTRSFSLDIVRNMFKYHEWYCPFLLFYVDDTTYQRLSYKISFLSDVYCIHLNQTIFSFPNTGNICCDIATVMTYPIHFQTINHDALNRYSGNFNRFIYNMWCIIQLLNWIIISLNIIFQGREISIFTFIFKNVHMSTILEPVT